MEPVYTDIHIHTSKDADKLNIHYDVETLFNEISKVNKGKKVLISLSDHNVINKPAYLKLKDFFDHIILGVELHVRNYDDAPPYHAHFLFNVDINEKNIDYINSILNKLYKKKMVSITDEIPRLEKIVQAFEDFDVLILPHGGQSHSTFDSSIPVGTIFDTTMERSVYYNQFDGFTSRSPEKIEKTIEYFRRLGIVEFINLITCSDNYDPRKYPKPQATNSSKFVPTWMLAEPTFEGLRISLSEKSRLIISDELPDYWQRVISSAKLKNEKIDIDVDFLPGLNVVIGGSSSGKTLLVDSIYRKLSGNWRNNTYKDYNVTDIEIKNLSNQVPHYIYQTYITSLFSDKNTIEDLDILHHLFPAQKDLEKGIQQAQARLQSLIKAFFDAVEKIFEIEDKLRQVPDPTGLLHNPSIRTNVISSFTPSISTHESCEFLKSDYQKFLVNLNEIEHKVSSNPFTQDLSDEFKAIRQELETMRVYAEKENDVYRIILDAKKGLDSLNQQLNEENKSKISDFEKLLSLANSFSSMTTSFYRLLKEIITSFKSESTKTESVGNYKLSVEYKMLITPELFIDSVNELFVKALKITSIDEVVPEKFFLDNFRDSLRGKKNYSDISEQVSSYLLAQNKKVYRIITNNGEDFDRMSPGKKSSIILDLILGHVTDSAPIIIDQPEDKIR